MTVSAVSSTLDREHDIPETLVVAGDLADDPAGDRWPTASFMPENT